jgi:hypothetical protein
MRGEHAGWENDFPVDVTLANTSAVDGDDGATNDEVRGIAAIRAREGTGGRNPRVEVGTRCDETSRLRIELQSGTGRLLRRNEVRELLDGVTERCDGLICWCGRYYRRIRRYGGDGLGGYAGSGSAQQKDSVVRVRTTAAKGCCIAGPARVGGGGKDAGRSPRGKEFAKYIDKCGHAHRGSQKMTWGYSPQSFRIGRRWQHCKHLRIAGEDRVGVVDTLGTETKYIH